MRQVEAPVKQEQEKSLQDEVHVGRQPPPQPQEIKMLDKTVVLPPFVDPRTGKACFNAVSKELKVEFVADESAANWQKASWLARPDAIKVEWYTGEIGFVPEIFLPEMLQGFCGLHVSNDKPYLVVAVGDVADVNGVLQGMPNCQNETIRPGDQIVGVDGHLVDHAPPESLSAMLRGAMHTVVEVVLLRPTTGSYYSVRLLRHKAHEFDGLVGHEGQELGGASGSPDVICTLPPATSQAFTRALSDPVPRSEGMRDAIKSPLSPVSMAAETVVSNENAQPSPEPNTNTKAAVSPRAGETSSATGDILSSFFSNLFGSGGSSSRSGVKGGPGTIASKRPGPLPQAARSSQVKPHAKQVGRVKGMEVVMERTISGTSESAFKSEDGSFVDGIMVMPLTSLWCPHASACNGPVYQRAAG